MDKETLIALFKKTGALLEGHFELSSGLHSDLYFQCARLLQYPEYAETLGREISRLFPGEKITCVVGPALGGMIIAYEVARALQARGLFAERVNGKMQLRRGFELAPGDSVLVVEDVVTTGGSAQEVVELVRERAHVAGVAAIVDRSSTPPLWGSIPFRSLATLRAATYEPGSCPLCRAGRSMDKPGSRRAESSV